jgi:hypothetical protein
MVKAVTSKPAKPDSPGKAAKPIAKDLPEKKKFAVQTNGKKVPVEPEKKPEPKKADKPKAAAKPAEKKMKPVADTKPKAEKVEKKSK